MAGIAPTPGSPAGEPPREGARPAEEPGAAAAPAGEARAEDGSGTFPYRDNRPQIRDGRSPHWKLERAGNRLLFTRTTRGKLRLGFAVLFFLLVACLSMVPALLLLFGSGLDPSTRWFGPPALLAGLAYILLVGGFLLRLSPDLRRARALTFVADALRVGKERVGREELRAVAVFPAAVGETYLRLTLLLSDRPPVEVLTDVDPRTPLAALEMIDGWRGGPRPAPPPEPPVLRPPDLDGDPLIELYTLRGASGQARVRRTRSGLELWLKGPLLPVVVASLVLTGFAAGQARELLRGSFEWGEAFWLFIILWVVLHNTANFLRERTLLVDPAGNVTEIKRELGLDACSRRKELGPCTFAIGTGEDNRGLWLSLHAPRTDSSLKSDPKPLKLWRGNAGTGLQRLCLSLEALTGRAVDGQVVVQAGRLPAEPVLFRDDCAELRWDGAAMRLSGGLHRGLLRGSLVRFLLFSPLFAAGLTPLFLVGPAVGASVLAVLLLGLLGWWLLRWLPVRRLWTLTAGEKIVLERDGERVVLEPGAPQVSAEPLIPWPPSARGFRLVIAAEGRRYPVAVALAPGFLCMLERTLRTAVEGDPEALLPEPSPPGGAS